MEQTPLDPRASHPRAHGSPVAGFDLAGWLGERAGRAARPHVQPAAPGKLNVGFELTSSQSADERIRRAEAYLAALPPAVAGERGHDRTFHAACVLVQGFALEVDQARPLLERYNGRCQPPWTTRELEHKLADAARQEGRHPRGWLLQGDRATEPGRAGSRRSGREDRARPAPPRQSETQQSETRQPPQPQSEPSTGRQRLQPESGGETNPHRLARLFLEQEFLAQGGIGLRFWRDEFYIWDGHVYHCVPTGEIRSRVARLLAIEFERIHDRAVEEARLSRRPAPRPIPVTSRLVGDVLQALASLVMVRVRDVPNQPAWLPPRPDQTEAALVPGPAWLARDMLPARNALVHLPSLMTGQIRTLPPSPTFFNAFSLDYDFDWNAPEPSHWFAFLNQIWPGDPESIACLQEWFGYLLTPDTRYQKILMMVGPKRSGRGTIARVLKALVGESTVVNPTLGTLARPFGLASLIGKSIAVFPDARLSSRPDNAAIVECLLSISGEDDQTIDRKHLPAWTGRLSTRFVLISNELPRLKDVSGALAARLIILRFTQSFYGREDLELLDRLMTELPGILRWAIAGWERLHRRGRFTQPQSARELVATMDELASPITAFLRDCCVQEPGASCKVSLVYEAWRTWCREHGRDAVGDEHSFGRDLHAAIPGLTTTRPRTPEGRVRLYQGLRLRTLLDFDADAESDR